VAHGPATLHGGPAESESTGGAGAGGPGGATLTAVTDAELEIREASEADLAVIVELAGSALGWRPDDPNEALFRWKHLANPFGPSPMWLAWDGDAPAGFRALLRWEFEGPGGITRRAVRAVDTATAPAYQGRGIFRRLTLEAVDQLAAAGVDFVFNTPNDQSRPGYLKMGWQEVGRVPVAVRPTSVGALRRMAAARVPAAKWSLATRAGRPAHEVLDDEEAVGELLGRLATPRGLRTPRRLDVLRWRYAEGPVRYRAVVLDDDPARGVALFRLRDRGGAVEATVGDVLVPGSSPGAARRLLDQIVDEARPDYLIATAGPLGETLGRRLLPAPRLGPILTWRALARPDMPAADEWSFALGDVELF